MWQYFLKRLVIMVPVIVTIMVISFILSRSAPNDPVTVFLGYTATESFTETPEQRRTKYLRASLQIGLDKPLFYLEMRPLSYPDTMHLVPFREERRAQEELLENFGNWPPIQDYFKALNAARTAATTKESGTASGEGFTHYQSNLQILSTTGDPADVALFIQDADSVVAHDSLTQARCAKTWEAVKMAHSKMVSEATPWKNYIPTLDWHGTQNQFHDWIAKVFQMDFGSSFVSKKQVGSMIADAIPWSIILGSVAYLLAFALAVMVGLYAVRHLGTWRDDLSAILLFAMYSIPTFVIGMLAMTFFCNPQYFHWFPTSGLHTDGSEKWPTYYRVVDVIYHLTLPTLVFAFHGIALLSRQLRASLADASTSDYARTARAKGLAEKIVLRRHALKNAMPPLIYSVTSSIPNILLGSVFIESIFSLPGMGNLSIEAMFNGDHPVIIAVFTLVAVATVLSNFLADILYAFFDPRVTYSKA